MNNPEQVLKTEYSESFDEKRKNAMVVSFHKYGPAKENYARTTCPISATDNIYIFVCKSG